MMPEMDGYETTKAIRAMDESRRSPSSRSPQGVKGDREKCKLRQAASDYITKPVDTDQLLSLSGVACTGSGSTQLWRRARPAVGSSPISEVEIELLLEGIFRHYALISRVRVASIRPPAVEAYSGKKTVGP